MKNDIEDDIKIETDNAVIELELRQRCLWLVFMTGTGIVWDNLDI